MMWLFIFGGVILLAIIGAIYLAVAIGRFAPFRRIQKKSIRFLLSLIVLAVVFIIVSKLMTIINAIIILLHVLFFFLLFGLIDRVVKNQVKKDIKINIQVWLAIITSVIYLSIGYYLCFNVWQTDYKLETDKNIEPIKMAMFADSHLGTTFDGDGFARHMETIREQSPDMLFIVGDFVDDDTSREDMIKACDALGHLDLKYGVFYVNGNHDRGYYSDRGFSLEDLEAELEKNGVNVLVDDIVYIGDYCIVGRQDASYNRADIADLLSGVDDSKYIVVLDHQPADYDNEAVTEADLVLSGHTHGGQMIPIIHWGKWSGIDDSTYGLERRNDTDFIVTSGISDWALYFKTGTKSEYVIITVE